MNIAVHMGKHTPCGYLGILGCGGYQNTDKIICMTASGGNHFLAEGIVEGTLLFVDTSREYQEGFLNVFKYSTTRSPQFKLSKQKVPEAEYVGKVLMSITQYCS